MEKKVVLTGFEPFGGSDINPSILACQQYSEENIKDFQVSVHEIPLRFNEIKNKIELIIEQEKPHVVICTGQSPRSLISLERIAINIADVTKSAYNCGSNPKDTILEENGPAGYFSSLPIRKIYEELEKNKIPSEISNSAGTYGCNQIFYHLMHYIKLKKYKTLAGFVHVPSLPEQVIGKNIPSMSLELIIKAIDVVVKTTLKEEGSFVE